MSPSFADTFKNVRLRNESDGTVPENELPPTFKDVNCVIAPSSSGSAPTKLFWDKSRRRTCVRLPMLGGRWPK